MLPRAKPTASTPAARQGVHPAPVWARARARARPPEALTHKPRTRTNLAVGGGGGGAAAPCRALCVGPRHGQRTHPAAPGPARAATRRAHPARKGGVELRRRLGGEYKAPKMAFSIHKERLMISLDDLHKAAPRCATRSRPCFSIRYHSRASWARRGRGGTFCKQNLFFCVVRRRARKGRRRRKRKKKRKKKWREAQPHGAARPNADRAHAQLHGAPRLDSWLSPRAARRGCPSSGTAPTAAPAPTSNMKNAPAHRRHSGALPSSDSRGWSKLQQPRPNGARGASNAR